MKINIAEKVKKTRVEGPGTRYALWVQGCPFRCPGCCNPHYQTDEVATIMDTQEIIDDILSVRDQIEGVTFIGGEPFKQARALARIARAVRKQGLSVMIFTGFKIEYLEKTTRLPGARELLATTDILVDGLFKEDEASRERRYIGSDNQRIFILTDMYEDLKDDWPKGHDAVELRWDGETLMMNGYPHPAVQALIGGEKLKFV